MVAMGYRVTARTEVAEQAPPNDAEPKRGISFRPDLLMRWDDESQYAMRIGAARLADRRRVA